MKNTTQLAGLAGMNFNTQFKYFERLTLYLNQTIPNTSSVGFLKNSVVETQRLISTDQTHVFQQSLPICIEVYIRLLVALCTFDHLCASKIGMKGPTLTVSFSSVFFTVNENSTVWVLSGLVH